MYFVKVVLLFAVFLSLSSTCNKTEYADLCFHIQVYSIVSMQGIFSMFEMHYQQFPLEGLDNLLFIFCFFLPMTVLCIYIFAYKTQKVVA